MPGPLLLALLSAGCSWTDRHGTHHLIVGIGFGLVTTTNRPGVNVYDGRVLGAAVGPDGAGVGWMQHHRVQIDPASASNLVIAIHSRPGGLTVTNFDLPAAGRPTAEEDSKPTEDTKQP